MDALFTFLALAAPIFALAAIWKLAGWFSDDAD